MTEAAAYMRCSGDSQISGDTWERQAERIQAFADAHGFKVVHWYREEGVSGKIECEQRPAFQTMLADLLSNGCRTIIVEDLSRLARRYAAQEQILLYLCAKELTLWTCSNGGDNITEGIQADPTRRLVIGMMGLISQWEREQIVAKLNAARERKRKADPQYREGRPAYGSKPGEAEVLQYVRERRAGGAGLKELVNELADRGIQARCGKPWTVGALHRVLSR